MGRPEVQDQGRIASDCTCECGKPAVAFWPVVDLDIPSNPYCRECLVRNKVDLLVELVDMGLW